MHANAQSSLPDLFTLWYSCQEIRTASLTTEDITRRMPCMFYVSCVCMRMSWLANHENLAGVHVHTYLGLALRAKD